MMSLKFLKNSLPTMLATTLVFLPVLAGASDDLTQLLTETVTCPDARTRVFDHYLAAYSHRQTPAENLNSNEPELVAIHKILTTGINNFAVATTDIGEKDPILHLIRLEMRSRIEPEYERVNEELDRALANARGFGTKRGIRCADSGRETIGNGQSLDSHAGEIAYAARRTMATAYQSCEVLDLPPVDSTVGNVDGVKKVIKIDEVGFGRDYSDLTLLKKTHYYHRVTKFSGNCRNQDRQPLVYDYGGEPEIDSNNGALNLFVDVGGGPALGIDCSAFVSTAVVSAGSLYHEGGRNRAQYTRFNSRDFIDPKTSRWSCFERVTVAGEANISAGDIAAVRGHVLMIDSVGLDPFGLAGVTDPSHCSDISPNDFDFVVIQSSPSKEHLGINRYVARDYLSEPGKMQNLFMRYAYQACLSKFDQRVRMPSTEQDGIIRHRRGGNCLAPRIRLKNENCVATCASL